MPASLRRRLSARSLAVLPLLLTVVLALGNPATPGGVAAGGPPPVSTLGQSQISSSADRAAGRIAPAVRQAVAAAAGPDTLLPVIVVSQGAAPSGLLQGAIARRPDARGLVFTQGRVRAGRISALAAANVVAILADTPPTAPVPPELATRGIGQAGGRPDAGIRHQGSEVRGQGSVGGEKVAAPTQNAAPVTNPQSAIRNPQSPDSWHTVDVQDVRPAWQAGYRGGGVKVALIDSGVDFGHPDLMNTYARVENPASPYYGWPLAFDPTSMELLAGGIVGDINNAVRGYGSWYIDTAATIHGERGDFQTVTATANHMDPITHTYQMPGTSRSGVYHIGILPDEHLAFDLYQEYVVVVVADTRQAGVYDTVYVDLTDSHDLRSGRALGKGHEVDGLDLNGDGLNDLSTGMLYFIADGQHPVPASDWMYGLLAPANGALVAMMGSYDYAEHHGTACASSVVAQGIVDGPGAGLRPAYKPSGVGGMVQGMAPDAKLVAIGNVYRGGMAIYDAQLLATYGLDGRPNSGDEPQIASMSFGFAGGVDSGWDFQSRYLAYLQADAPYLSFVAATGNGGPGYGSMTPPAAAPNVIAVGAATQYGETTTFDVISSTQSITWGDIQPWSDRGPTIGGNAGPAVVAVGAWGTADSAPNAARDGANAYELWGGTSMATPITAGVLALGYNAYQRANGGWPTAGTARELLTSSACDLHYGPFTQGAGLVDGGRLAQLAANQGGLQVSPTRWTPGQTAPFFAGYVAPGGTATTTLTLSNPGPAPLTATVASDVLLESGYYDWNVNSSNSDESAPSFSRPDYLRDLTGVIPRGTDLMRVQAVISYTEFTLSDPLSQFLFWHNTFRLLAYDWQDKNHDGRLWTDSNANGVVQPGEIQPGEYNRLWYSYPKADMMEGFIERPLERIHDGLWIGLQHADGSNLIPHTHLTLRATFYRHSPWTVLTAGTAALTVPAHGDAAVGLTLRVPAGMAAGAYEGAVRVTSAGGTSLMPVALNVALPQLGGSFGGTPPAPTVYDSGRMTGAGNWAWRPDSGDWRHFFAVNTATPPANSYLWVNTTWPHYPTDNDTFLLGPAPQDYYSVIDPARFGPYDLWGIGGSVYNYQGGGQWGWQTATGGPSEWVSGPLGQPGLHEVVIHNVWYSGAALSEPFTGTLGTVTLSTGAINLDTDRTQDQAVISVTTALTLPKGLIVTGYGLSQREVIHDQPIRPEGTYFYELPLSNTASVEFSTQSATNMDLYLFIDYFDGTRWIWLGGGGGGGPAQYFRVEPAHDGRYRVRVDGGLNVPTAGSLFDLTIKAVRGGDLTVTPARVPGPIQPGTTLTFTIGYNRPGLLPGLYDGKVFIGPTDAPALVSLPMTVRYGHPTPEPTPSAYPCLPTIRDVPPTDWAYPAIRDLYCRGIVGGYIDRTFHPGDLTSRVQFLAMLGRARNWALLTPLTPTFNDVPPTFWGYAYIETAAHYGLISGYSDGGFHPVAPVTRAQVAKLIVGAADWPAAEPPNPNFHDVPGDYWAYSAIAQVAFHGLVSGYNDHTFHPAAYATRAQLAKIVDGLLTATP